jgi:electron transport complex protein RnfC
MTFAGGVHPFEGKDFSARKKIEKLPPPQKIFVPLQQHIGAPANPLAEKGQEVKIGEKIGEANGLVSAPIHASISGKVVAIQNIDHPVSGKGDAIVIESDNKETWLRPYDADENFMAIASKEMLKRIKECGIAGLGGATFPTHVKLSPPPNKKIDVAILNGIECEPYLTADHRLMLEYSDDIINGFQIIMKLLGVSRGIIGIENNKQDAIKLFIEKVKKRNGIQVAVFPVKYPQGAEKQLIKAALNREVPSGGLPMDVGVVVQNVGTAKAVFDAVSCQKPLTHRIVTVTGPGVNEPKNVLVPIGTTFKNVVDFCGGLTKNASKIIMGGPMMGITQPNLDVPVIKGTSGIVIFEDNQAHLPLQEPCICCGRCVEFCPVHLLPTTLQILVDHERYEESENYHIMDCIECGTCSYICPANRYLLHSIRQGKRKIIESRRKTG